MSGAADRGLGKRGRGGLGGVVHGASNGGRRRPLNSPSRRITRVPTRYRRPAAPPLAPRASPPPRPQKNFPATGPTGPTTGCRWPDRVVTAPEKATPSACRAPSPWLSVPPPMLGEHEP